MDPRAYYGRPFAELTPAEQLEFVAYSDLRDREDAEQSSALFRR